MRLQSKTQVKVKDTVIGGEQPLVCLPIVAEEQKELLDQAREFVSLGADLIEWRVDAYAGVTDIRDCLRVLKELQAVIHPIPLIFTCRIEAEGGLCRLGEQDRLNLIKEALGTGLADIVDVELCSGPAFIAEVVQAAKASGAKVILSSHDFAQTPSRETMAGKLTEAWHQGADIAKLAAMPRDYTDVLALMEATMTARTSGIDIPLVTISMGDLGRVSRVSGGVFGSDITFAVGRKASAPGQIPIGLLRQAMSVLYG